MKEYRKERIKLAVIELGKNYQGNIIDEGLFSIFYQLDEEESEYANNLLDFEKITGLPNNEFVFRSLENPVKREFIARLLKCAKLNFEVNFCNEQQQTVFQYITEYIFNHPGYFTFYDNPYLTIYRNGYVNKAADISFLKTIYDTRVKSPRDMEQWCFARFAFVLNDYEMIKMAYAECKVLFTILSLKLKKPIGIGYPNLLGIANSALLHYTTHAEMIVRALHVYNVYNDILKRDQKGTFKLRYQDIEETDHVQDEYFQKVILKIFPELA